MVGLVISVDLLTDVWGVTTGLVTVGVVFCTTAFSSFLAGDTLGSDTPDAPVAVPVPPVVPLAAGLVPACCYPVALRRGAGAGPPPKSMESKSFSKLPLLRLA